MSQAIESPNPNLARLSELLLRAESKFSERSATKWKPVSALIAEIAELQPAEVQVKYSARSGAYPNRLTEAGRGLRLKCIIVELNGETPTSEDVAQLVKGAQRKVSEQFEAVLLLGKYGDNLASYHVLAVLDRQGNELGYRLAQALGTQVKGSLGGSVMPPSIGSQATTNLGDLAASLNLPERWLEEARWFLEDRKAVVFYGPPGTGKTFIAHRLCQALSGSNGAVRVLQLHPSYSYEDFVEGYRPKAGEDGLELQKQSGPLLQIAALARANPTGRYFVLLDEINRANIPRVFGELLFLMEYRKESADLMYSPGEGFTLPANVYFVGTMNTSDRSIATVDQALRRRFHFLPLFPDREPIRSVLRAHLLAKSPAFMWLADVVDLANERLGNRHSAIGPSHFLGRDLDDTTIELIWRGSVLPSIEEQFWNRPDEVDAFSLDSLREEVEKPDEEP